MLSVMHNDNYIKKFKTKDIIMTYGPTEEGRMPLNKLNEMIAKEKGVKVNDIGRWKGVKATMYSSIVN